MIPHIHDISVTEKRVLVRVDFNVPMHQGTITDDTRIRAAIPTIQLLLDKRAKIIIMSHLGRPNGPSATLSLQPCAQRLQELLQKPVLFVPDCIGPQTEEVIVHMQPQDIVVLENLRFYEEEEQGEAHFTKQLAHLGDCYINDAFGTAHRAHASTACIAHYFPQAKAAGLLLLKEIEALSSTLIQPKQPFVAIIGGAKVSSKLKILQSLLQKAETLLIGGAMAYTFMKAEGRPIGTSPVEEAMIPHALDLLHFAQQSGKQICLPIDFSVAQECTATAPIQTMETIPEGYQGVDIGPKTIAQWKPIIKQAKTIFWNGPVGVFEFASCAQGTLEIATAIAQTPSAFSVLGGGDSIAAIEQLHMQTAISHISTGGGAALEFIENGTLPGIEALK